MRPSLISRARSSRRAILLSAAGAIVVGGVLAAALPTHGGAPAPERVLSQELGTRTWALAIPVAWLSAPIPGLRHDDVLDILGTRSSERANTTEVATGLRVMSADDRVVVVELTDGDASAIAAARARGLALIPILRSVR
jgi:hypothetical protein